MGEPAAYQPDSGRWMQRRRAAVDAIPPVEEHVEGETMRVTRQFRGLTVEQAMRYLEHLGGERTSPHTIEGEGWQAHLTTGKAPVGPSYRLTVVTVTWTGRKAVVEPLVQAFQLKTFRAPG